MALVDVWGILIAVAENSFGIFRASGAAVVLNVGWSREAVYRK
jgi:hypothetical protein